MFSFTQNIDSCSVSKQNPEPPEDFSELFPLCPLHLASINKYFMYPMVIRHTSFSSETTLANKIKINWPYPFNVTDRSEWQLFQLFENSFCVSHFLFKLQHSSLSINSLNKRCILDLVVHSIHYLFEDVCLNCHGRLLLLPDRVLGSFDQGVGGALDGTFGCFQPVHGLRVGVSFDLECILTSKF